jgi:hypothetical protein
MGGATHGQKIIRTINRADVLHTALFPPLRYVWNGGIELCKRPYGWSGQARAGDSVLTPLTFSSGGFNQEVTTRRQENFLQHYRAWRTAISG